MKKQSPPRCDVALLVDEETGRRRGERFVPDRGSVEEHVLRALRRRYRAVEVVPFLVPASETARRLRALAPRVVFNLTEWIDGDRTQDAAIAGLLERLKLAYTGTGPAGLRLARDKARASRAVARLGITVPSRLAPTGGGLPHGILPFPAMVKPRFGDASEQISGRSVVATVRELRERAAAIRARTRQPAVCEAFVPGRDLYVGLLGSEPRVLPAVELVVGRSHRAAPAFATWHLKHDPRYRARWRVRYRRARLPRATAKALARASRRIFRALKLRDYARLDFRLTPDHRLYFIEANPNPDLDPHALNRSGCFAGVPYGRLIATIVENARRRTKARALGRSGDREIGRSKNRK